MDSIRAFAFTHKLAPSTLNRYSSVWRLLAQENDCSIDILISEIITSKYSPEHAYIVLNRAISTGNYAGRTILSYTSAVHSLFHGLDKSISLDDTLLKDIRKSWLRRWGSREMSGSVFLRFKDLQDIIDICIILEKQGRVDRNMHLALCLALIFLLRIGEVLDLTWKEIEKGLFFGRDRTRHVGIRVSLDESKTHGVYDEPQIVTAFESKKVHYCAIEFWKKLKRARKSNIFVISRKNGEPRTTKSVNAAIVLCIAYWKDRNTFNKTHTLFDLNKKFRFHSIRASMIAILFRWGFSGVEVKKRARHKRLDTSLKYENKSTFMPLIEKDY